MRPSSNPLSAPALSLKRLQVSWGDRSSQSFLALLAERAGLERRGERLLRPEL